MSVDFNFMIGGEAGQGVQTIAFVLAKAMMRGGFNVYSDQDFESRIRGGHSFSRVRVRDREVQALSEKVNILIALNRETIERHKAEMKPQGEALIIFDAAKTKSVEDKGRLLDVPFERLATEATSNKVMSNTVALGAALGLIEYDFELLAQVLREEFSRHGEETAEQNVKAARTGYDYARGRRGDGFSQRLKPVGGNNRILLTGHEAVALGAMAAGCKFVAGYPMTPTTAILEYIASKGRDYNIKAVQTEDEISAINMVVGAAFVGVRAMTATSGGGFCLMVEGLSLAGMTETPLVIVLGQRPGPAIGLPTRTEQGELEFALHAGHGEFPRALLAPANAEDAFWLTVKAFNLAEKYQSPVIVLTDHDLAESYSTVAPFDLSQVKIERGQLLSAEEVDRLGVYKRHLITESGISPRALPLRGRALVVTDSDEHNEEGHIIEDAETRRQMMLKRMRKLDGLRSEISSPRINRKPGAKITLVGWGSTYGAIREAQERLSEDGLPVNHLHLSELWPFPTEEVVSILGDSSKNVVIESNATGQLARLIRTETSIKADASILRFDGRPFSAEYITNELRKEV